MCLQSEKEAYAEICKTTLRNDFMGLSRGQTIKGALTAFLMF